MLWHIPCRTSSSCKFREARRVVALYHADLSPLYVRYNGVSAGLEIRWWWSYPFSLFAMCIMPLLTLHLLPPFLVVVPAAAGGGLPDAIDSLFSYLTYPSPHSFPTIGILPLSLLRRRSPSSSLSHSMVVQKAMKATYPIRLFLGNCL